MERISTDFGRKKSLKQKRILTVGDVALSHKPLSFSPEEYVKIVLPLMLSSEGGAVGVIDENEHLVGLLTEREVLKKIFYTTSDPFIHSRNIGKYIDDMIVRDVMISSPETLSEHISLEEGLAIMVKQGYRYMPVVRKYDKTALVGIVSDRELSLHARYRDSHEKRIGGGGKAAFSHLMRKPYGSNPNSFFLNRAPM